MKAGIYDKWGKKIGFRYPRTQGEPPVRSSELVMPKIKATTEVRKLLIDLDQAFLIFHSQTGILAEEATADTVARDVGAERESQKRIILGIAYRINKASRGEA
ncbi:MAG: hypothetical protein ACYDH9_08050 [Limisphaerales bacterium]